MSYTIAMTFHITPEAGTALSQLLEAKGAGPKTGLRLGVEKGGCAGWQYVMKVGEPEEKDIALESPDAPVYIMADSAQKLDGCQLGYSDALSDAGFKITNPSAARSCGCGTSFEAADDAPEEKTDPALDGVACGD